MSTAAMVIPQGMSYANLAGLPYAFGLYGAFVPCIVYAFLGSSRQLVRGGDGRCTGASARLARRRLPLPACHPAPAPRPLFGPRCACPPAVPPPSTQLHSHQPTPVQPDRWWAPWR